MKCELTSEIAKELLEGISVEVPSFLLDFKNEGTTFYNVEDVYLKALEHFSANKKSNDVYIDVVYSKDGDKIYSSKVFFTRNGYELIWNQNPYESDKDALNEDILIKKDSFNSYSVDKIKSILDNYGLSYDSSDKDILIDLLNQNNITPDDEISLSDLLSSLNIDNSKVDDNCIKSNFAIEIPDSHEIEHISEDYCTCGECARKSVPPIEKDFDFDAPLDNTDVLNSLIDTINEGVDNIKACSATTQQITDNLYSLIEAKDNLLVLQTYFYEKHSHLENIKKQTFKPVVTLNTFTSVLTNPFQLSNFINDKVESLRKPLYDHSISSNIGVDKNLFYINVNKSSKQLISDIFSSVYRLNFELSNFIGELTKREGYLNDFIWNKFYNKDRIDQMFTEAEQGYISPKPKFDKNGNVIGPTTNIQIKAADGTITNQTVASSINNLQIDDKVASEFWTNIESKTFNRIKDFENIIIKDGIFNTFLEDLKKSARDEVEYVYSINTLNDSKLFDDSLKGLYYNVIIDKISYSNYYIDYKTIVDFISIIEAEISRIQKSLDDQKTCMHSNAARLAGSVASVASNSNAAVLSNKNCKELLGKYPKSSDLFSNNCPGISKNCYWEEWTKILQSVSFLPIIDIGNLQKRLFRYYPVGLQIPSPVSLPTLASGIPDVMISIPMPFIWQHLITVQSSMGIIVTWLAMAGPIPCPFVMIIDEKGKPFFMASFKGKSEIPASSLNVQDSDKKSLYDTAIKPTFSVPNLKMNSLIKGEEGSPSDLDGYDAIVKEIKNKIRDSLSQTNLQPNPNNANELKRKKKVDKLLNGDKEALELFKQKVFTDLDNLLGQISISSISLPKDSAKTDAHKNWKSEKMENLKTKKISSVDRGTSSKVFDLKKFINEQLNNIFFSKDFKNDKDEIDRELISIENGKQAEKVARRKSLCRKTFEKLVSILADSINTKSMGIQNTSNYGISDPFNCYQMPSSGSLDPKVFVAIQTIKSLINIVKQSEIEDFISSIGASNIVKSPMATISNYIGGFVKSFANTLVPSLSFSLPNNSNIGSMLKASDVLEKFVMRMPRVGIPLSSLSGDSIKSLIAGGIKDVLNVIFTELENNIHNLTKLVSEFMMIFGSLPSEFDGKSIVNLVYSILDSVLVALKPLKPLIDVAANAPKVDFKSIKAKFVPFSSDDIFDSGGIKNAPGLKRTISDLFLIYTKLNIPFPVFLQSAAVPGLSSVLTKLHPYVAYEFTPQWEQLSTGNLPFMLWFNWFLYTAQKNTMFSDYVAPYTSL